MHLRVTFVAAARSSSLLAERFEDDRPLDQAGWDEVQRAAPGNWYHWRRPSCATAHRPRAAVPPATPSGTRRWRNPRCATANTAAGAASRWVRRWPASRRRSTPGSPTACRPARRRVPTSFISRVGGWLGTRPADDGSRIVAVAEPSVVRAALVYALKAQPSTYWNIDVRPLSTITLTGVNGRWNLRLEGVPQHA